MRKINFIFGAAAVVLGSGLVADSYMLGKERGILESQRIARPVAASCAATHEDLAGIRALLYRGMEDDAFVEMPQKDFDKIAPARDFLWDATNQVEHLWRVSRDPNAPEIPTKE